MSISGLEHSGIVIKYFIQDKVDLLISKASPTILILQNRKSSKKVILVWNWFSDNRIDHRVNIICSLPFKLVHKEMPCFQFILSTDSLSISSLNYRTESSKSNWGVETSDELIYLFSFIADSSIDIFYVMLC